MKIDSLQWDDANIEHIGLKHNVSPEEVEDVCFGIHLSRAESRRRYILAGQTARGRYLYVVLERIRGMTFRPITAFEMNDEHKHRFRRRLKKLEGRKR